MTVLFHDNFDGSGDLVDHIADIGGGWSEARLTLLALSGTGTTSWSGYGVADFDMSTIGDFTLAATIITENNGTSDGNKQYQATLSVRGEDWISDGGGTFFEVSRDTSSGVSSYDVSLRTANTGSLNPPIASISWDGSPGSHVISIASVNGELTYSFDGVPVATESLATPGPLRISTTGHWLTTDVVFDSIEFGQTDPLPFWSDKILCTEVL